MNTRLDDDDTVALVTLVRTPQGFLWRVKRCPFCGKPHTHGGGLLRDDPRRLLGGRVAHCLRPRGDDVSRHYVLIEEAEVR